MNLVPNNIIVEGKSFRLADLVDNNHDALKLKVKYENLDSVVHIEKTTKEILHPVTNKWVKSDSYAVYRGYKSK